MNENKYLEEYIEDYEDIQDFKKHIKSNLKTMSEKAYPHFLNTYYIYNLGKKYPECLYDNLNRAFEDTLEKERKGYKDEYIFMKYC
jgi:hypothetical protein